MFTHGLPGHEVRFWNTPPPKLLHPTLSTSSDYSFNCLNLVLRIFNERQKKITFIESPSSLWIYNLKILFSKILFSLVIKDHLLKVRADYRFIIQKYYFHW